MYIKRKKEVFQMGFVNEQDIASTTLPAVNILNSNKIMTQVKSEKGMCINFHHQSHRLVLDSDRPGKK